MALVRFPRNGTAVATSHDSFVITGPTNYAMSYPRTIGAHKSSII